MNPTFCLSWTCSWLRSAGRGKTTPIWQTGTNKNSRFQIRPLWRTPKVISTAYSLIHRRNSVLWTSSRCLTDNPNPHTTYKALLMPTSNITCVLCHLLDKGHIPAFFQHIRNIKEEVYFQPLDLPSFSSPWLYVHLFSLPLSSNFFCLNTTPLWKYFW